MTREEILAMEPGRKIDALVAEKVMGAPTNDYYFVMDSVRAYDRDGNSIDWSPSTDISAAWEVVEKFMDMEISKNGSDYVASMDHPGHYVQSKSAAEAICKAALLAVMEVTNGTQS